MLYLCNPFAPACTAYPLQGFHAFEIYSGEPENQLADEDANQLALHIYTFQGIPLQDT